MDDRLQCHPAHRWWWYVGNVISLVLLGGLLAGSVDLLAVQRGVPPPTFAVAVGPVELSAPCPSNGDFCPPSPPHYTIWLMVRRPGTYTVEVYQLMNFRIDAAAGAHISAARDDTSA